MENLLEIDPEAFESELAAGDDVAVIDTRPADSYSRWHVDSGLLPIVNVPEEEVPNRLDLLAEFAAPGRSLRTICSTGVSSLRVAEYLDARGLSVRSVRGGMVGWSRVLQRDEIRGLAPFRVVQFRREARGCLSYLVAASGDAIVVDPAPSVDAYLAEASKLGVRIVCVFDTHVHADHLSGARELARLTAATLAMADAAISRGVRYGSRVEVVTDGDELTVGDRRIRVMALPGHTSDMTGLLLEDEAALLGGDSLFLDSVARPDLEDGQQGAAQAASTLWHTLDGRIGSLPDSTLLLPCHWSGGRVSGPVALPLGVVRAQVEELAVSPEEFVRLLLEQLPPTPENHGCIVAVNLGEEVDADEAARLEVGANRCAAKAAWNQHALA
jgi:glyoxylase-like metal-dependent hydrolase (beta-lactamase superfamily II)/rhodanese-related sulfurtransferase